MKSFALLSAIAALGTVSATPTLQDPPSKRADLPVITASGNAFWAGKERFYVRGIDYQPGGSSANVDPLADTKICKRDIENFKDLGINTVRVYAVDNSKDHKECMDLLADAGIYLVADVNNNEYALNRSNPHPSYNTDYLQSVFATVEELAKYDNVMALFSGNEVINDELGTYENAPYIKAVTRDIKNYINQRGLRQIPVGYSAADVSINREQTAHYMNCGSDDARSDFFAFNDYSWCNTDFQESGWDQKVKTFTDYGLPIFLSEYGCIDNRPRKFEELGALMSDEMSSVYSGGLMYEYSNEGNKYGIVDISSSGSVKKLSEYKFFKDSLSKNKTPTGSGGAASSTHSVPCPKRDTNEKNQWNVDPKFIPTMPEKAAKFMKEGAGKGPGLKGSGSMRSSDSGTATESTTGGVPSPTNGSSGDGDGDEDDAASTLMNKGTLMVTGLAVSFTLVGTLLL